MPTSGKTVLQRQTAHADAVAGLPVALSGLRRASVVDSTADFLNSAQLPPFVTETRNVCMRSLL